MTLINCSLTGPAHRDRSLSYAALGVSYTWQACLGIDTHTLPTRPRNGRLPYTPTEGFRRALACHLRCIPGYVRGLTTCSHSQLISSAMRDASSKTSRLHRDISIGNIILVKEPGRETRRGYLIDWETSSPLDSEGRSLDKNRTVSVKVAASVNRI